MPRHHPVIPRKLQSETSRMAGSSPAMTPEIKKNPGGCPPGFFRLVRRTGSEVPAPTGPHRPDVRGLTPQVRPLLSSRTEHRVGLEPRPQHVEAEVQGRSRRPDDVAARLPDRHGTERTGRCRWRRLIPVLADPESRTQVRLPEVAEHHVPRPSSRQALRSSGYAGAAQGPNPRCPSTDRRRQGS